MGHPLFANIFAISFILFIGSSTSSAFSIHPRNIKGPWTRRSSSLSAAISGTAETACCASTFLSRSTIAVTAPRRRRTFSRVREGTLTMGLFGLGGPEIAVIAVVAGLVLGPEKLSGLARDFGKVAGELKDVPKEFQEGLSEGDAAIQAQKELVAASDKNQSETETESAPTAIEENA